jgi:hypothetical protein
MMDVYVAVPLAVAAKERRGEERKGTTPSHDLPNSVPKLSSTASNCEQGVTVESSNLYHSMGSKGICSTSTRT